MSGRDGGGDGLETCEVPKTCADVLDESGPRPLVPRAEDRFADASVYGTLKRLELANHVSTRYETSTSGPPRKYYRLTAAGRRELRVLSDDWNRLVAAVEGIGGRNAVR
jgi:hypothetical protein